MTNNTPQLEALVRRIVREVLAGGPTATIQTNTDEKLQRLCLSDARVVTIEELDGRIEGFDEVTVGAMTVVTPAARDMLRSLGIALVRAAADKSLPKSKKQHAIRIADADSPDRQAAFARQLALRDGANAECGPMEQASVILADVPPPVVWRLCQAGKVAVQIGSLEELQRVKTAMQPSNWVLDMGRLNIASATNIALRIIREEK